MWNDSLEKLVYSPASPHGTEVCPTAPVVLYIVQICLWGTSWLNPALVANGEQIALPSKWRTWPQCGREVMGVMLYLVVLLYSKRSPSTQSTLTSKSWSYSFLHLQPVWDSALCRELYELQKHLDGYVLSGSCLHYVNIWKKSIHIINSSSKSAFIK